MVEVLSTSFAHTDLRRAKMRLLRSGELPEELRESCSRTQVWTRLEKHLHHLLFLRVQQSPTLSFERSLGRPGLSSPLDV